MSRSRAAVAVIGIGRMGQRHVAAALELERSGLVELVATYDTDLEVARVAPRAVATLKEAVRRSELVIVATPTPQHALVAREVLRAGRHVLVEKPLSSSLLEARELVSEARGAGRLLAVGMCERQNVVVRQVRASLPSVTIRGLRLHRCGPRRVGRSAPRVGRLPLASDGGRWAGPLPEIVTELSVHDLDLVAFLTGSPVIEVVPHVGSTSEWGPDDVLLEVRTASGVRAEVRTIWRPDAPRERRLVVAHETDGLLEFDLLAMPPTSGPGRSEAVRSTSGMSPLVHQLDAVLKATSGATPASAEVVTGNEALALLTVLTQAVWSTAAPAVA